MKQIAKNIKKLRKSKGMTQAKLAEKLGLTRSSVGNYEKGVLLPSLPIAYKMSTIFGVSINSLIENNPHK